MEPIELNKETILLRRVPEETLLIPIIGVSPLIEQKWSEKSRNLMLSNMLGELVEREARNPEQEANDSTYWLPDGQPGFPAVGFKAAIVEALSAFKIPVAKLSQKDLKKWIYVHGEGPENLVRIDGEWSMREDAPRNANGGTDLRFRNAFYPWAATLKVTYRKSILRAGDVVNLVHEAGKGGVGSWRPSSPKAKTGTFGVFEVDSAKGVYRVSEEEVAA